MRPASLPPPASQPVQRAGIGREVVGERGAVQSTAAMRSSRRDCAGTATGAARRLEGARGTASNRPNATSGCGWRPRAANTEGSIRPIRSRARSRRRPRTAGLPAAHRVGDPIEVAEAKAMQRGDGRGRHGFHAAEVQVRGDAGGLRQVRHVLEHVGVAGADPLQVGQQRLGERGGVGVAHEGGEARQVLGPLGQLVGLAVGDHLQPVLDARRKR